MTSTVLLCSKSSQKQANKQIVYLFHAFHSILHMFIMPCVMPQEKLNKRERSCGCNQSGYNKPW